MKSFKETIKELHVECFQAVEGYAALEYLKNNWRYLIYIPYLPAFHTPGWLIRYIFGPYNLEWLEMFLGDFSVGITVAAAVVP